MQHLKTSFLNLSLSNSNGYIKYDANTFISKIYTLIMNYCHNCGAKIESNITICPYCGQSFDKKDKKQVNSEKDLKIQELELKIATLEKKTTSHFGFSGQNLKYFWIMAIIMIIFFFSFMFFFVWMARGY